MLSCLDVLLMEIIILSEKFVSITLFFFYLCLVRGILTQLAAATAIKGTQRARRGGAVWMIHNINRCT